MEQLIDIYASDPDIVSELLHSEKVRVDLKMDGIILYAVYNKETDKLEYYNQGENENKLGSIITDYNRLLCRDINNAIMLFDTKAELLKSYNFLKFELIDSMILLSGAMKNNKFIESASELGMIAKKINVDIKPALFDGKLSEEQINLIIDILSTGIIPSCDKMTEWVKSMFISFEYLPEKFIKPYNNYIKGITFIFSVNGKKAVYDIIDPEYTKMLQDIKNASSHIYDHNSEYYNEIYTYMLEWLEKNQIRSSKDSNTVKSKIEIMQKNFLAMMKDVNLYNKLMNIGSNIIFNTSKNYTIQPDYIIPELEREFNRCGDIYKNLFEHFIKTFYNKRKHGFIISQEFQDRINKVSDLF